MPASKRFPDGSGLTFLHGGKKMKRSTLVYTTFIVALTVVFMSFNGCEALRKPPTEAQKQTARMGIEATADIWLTGTTPQSPVATIAHESAKATQTYFGLPTQPLADPARVIPQAQVDAAERPDPWNTLDLALSLGLAAAGVFGGAGGLKVARAIAVAQKKSKALREIVKAQQNFRDELKLKADSDDTGRAAEILQSLKDANDDLQSPSTIMLVTEVKSAIPRAPKVPFKEMRV